MGILIMVLGMIGLILALVLLAISGHNRGGHTRD